MSLAAHATEWQALCAGVQHEIVDTILMRANFCEGLPCAHHDRSEQPHWRDSGANPCTVFGIDLPSGDMQDVGLDLVDHPANLIAVVRERQRHTPSARTNRSQNFVRHATLNRFGNQTRLSHHYSD